MKSGGWLAASPLPGPNTLFLKTLEVGGRMKKDVRLVVIAIFFSGLGLLAAVEAGLARLLGSRLDGLPWLAVFMLACGLILVIWSVGTLYAAGLGTPAPVVPTRKLVRSGPYRCSRNPMTLGALLIYLGLAVWAGSWGMFALVLGVFAVLLRYIYMHESEELAGRFGVEYLEYRRSTPFLFPRFRP
jgi:protein-S-isoprenylcysteine O-methyltransferase Ste14